MIISDFAIGVMALCVVVIGFPTLKSMMESMDTSFSHTMSSFLFMFLLTASAVLGFILLARAVLSLVFP